MTELELTSPGSITEETVAQGTAYGKQDVARLRKSYLLFSADYNLSFKEAHDKWQTVVWIRQKETRGMHSFICPGVPWAKCGVFPCRDPLGM